MASINSNTGDSGNIYFQSNFIHLYTTAADIQFFLATDFSGFSARTSPVKLLGVNEALQIEAPAVNTNQLLSDYQSVYVSTTDGTLGYVSSSITTKKNVEPLQLSIDSILAAEPVQFNYKSEENGSAKHAGFIAEQLIEAGLGGYVSFDGDGNPVTVNYDMFVSALQLVARQHAAEIEALNVRLSALERD